MHIFTNKETKKCTSKKYRGNHKLQKKKNTHNKTKNKKEINITVFSISLYVLYLQQIHGQFLKTKTNTIICIKKGKNRFDVVSYKPT